MMKTRVKLQPAIPMKTFSLSARPFAVFWALHVAASAALLPARAEIPEPDNVIYGVITLGVTPVTAANTNVVVEARKTATGTVVASYRMGENPAYGNRYLIEIPLEAFFPLTDTNSSRVGAVVYLSVRDNSGVRDSRTLSIAQRGQVVRLDFTELDTDGDGLPDRWEQQYFGSATGANPTADSDGDGRSNLQEFLDGTNPLNPDGRHPADNSPANYVLSFEEAEAYAAAWQVGTPWPSNPTNIPISHVARAAALALAGSPYLFTNTPPTNAPMWWVSTPYSGPRPPGMNLATSLALPSGPAVGVPFTVTLRVVPTNTFTAFAVQDQPPTGWTNVQNISHGGFYDTANAQVKWGPFYDNVTRDLTYDLTRPSSASGNNTFIGIASFDGYNVAVTGARTINTGAAPPTWTSSSVTASNRFSFTLHGAATNRYAIEGTTNFITWTTLQTNLTDASGNYVFKVTNAPPLPARFYRARLVP